MTVTAVPGLPEIVPGFEFGAALAGSVDIADGDVIVISQKVVSKAENRLVDLSAVEPGAVAQKMGAELDHDPRLVELILRESRRIVRADPERGILITETRHGFVCANAGIDASNLRHPGTVALLPEDPDGSARRIRAEITAAAGTRPAVIISDSFGRAWRLGQVEVAIGMAGIGPLDDWRGRTDRAGTVLEATSIGIADEIAAAADLIRDKTSGTPAALVRGLGRYVGADDGPGCGAQIRSGSEDLFR
ncbi:MAG: coenzyme F420-0:L-glutamate ligase [Thermoleophilia bacterium]|nr:coenzyme F420-0:L-glutamate ligase [Thermoleophilia bacterium]